MTEVEIWTDGACKVHTSKLCSWSFVVVNDNEVLYEDFNVEENKTSNQMEMTAVLNAMKFLYDNPVNCEINIFSDSKYVVDGLSKWVNKWVKNNWLNSSGKEVANKELWVVLYEYSELLNLKPKWVKGHDELKWNEYAHELCQNALINFENIKSNE